MNKFIEKKINHALSKYSDKEFKSFIEKTAETLEKFGIDSEEKLIKWQNIKSYVPILVRKATGINNEYLNSIVFKNVYNKYASSINTLEDLQQKTIEALGEVKLAYPEGYLDSDPIKVYDVNSWISIANDVYMKMRLFGKPKQELIAEATKGWGDMDRVKFYDWLKYYEDGANKVYKTAAPYGMTGTGVAFPVSPVPQFEQIAGFTQTTPAPQSSDTSTETRTKEEAKENFEKVRGQLISRINSAIKILSSQNGKGLVGSDYNRLLGSLMDLQKDLYTIKTASMLEDIIIRAKNTLIAEGFDDSATMLVKIAQEIPPPPADAAAPPMPPAGPETSAGGTKEALISVLDDLTDGGMKENIENLKKINEEHGFANPGKKAWYQTETDEFFKFCKIANIVEEAANNARKLYKIAQAPADVLAAPKQTSLTTSFIPEDAIDKAFANITVNDVIKRLQALSRVFKNREIARQLSFIDLMLDKLGIAGLFPQLAEATRSALESNQYSSIRIEEVLSKLTSVIDESGKVNVNISETGNDKSIIDEEMAKALQQSEMLEKQTAENVSPAGNIEMLPEEAPSEEILPKAPIGPEAKPQPLPTMI